MKNSSVILLIAAVGILSSCGTNYYIPTAQNVPMFQEKGEASITAGISIKETMAVQGAYAFANNFAIKGHFAARKGSYSTIEQFETGLAYFGKINKFLVYEVEAGFGRSNVQRSPSTFDMSFNRQYLQPMIGFTSDYFDAGISTKLSRIRYDVDIYNLENAHDKDVGDYNNSAFTIIEPAYTIRVGYKYVKFQAQYVQSEVLGTKELEGYFQDISLMLVFKYPFGKKKNK